MCYYISTVEHPKQLEKGTGAKLDPKFPYLHQVEANGFSNPKLPVISNEDPELIVGMQWGLIPTWAKDNADAAKLSKMTLNAKIETVFEKPAFKESVLRSRCVLLAHGFYEWQKRGKNKQQYFITLKDKEILPMAGIFTKWYNEESELVYSFSVLTTEANELMAEIHNDKKRMPLMLNDETLKLWISDQKTADIVEECFQTIDSNLLNAKPLISAQESMQTSLF